MKKIILMILCFISISFAGEFSVYEANYPNVKDYNLDIDDGHIEVFPRGNYLEFNLYLTVSYDFNSWFFKNYNELEFLWKFSLPDYVIMTDFELWVTEDSSLTATVMDKWTAELLFSDVSTPVRHPGLFTQSEATREGKVNYELKIFPIKREESRKFRIQYLVPGRPASNALRAWLPTTQIMAKYTPKGLKKLDIVYHYENISETPRVVGIDPIATSQSESDSTWTLTIPLQYDQFAELVVPSPIENQFYLSTFNYENENYYHLAVLPPKVEKIKSDRKILIAVDFNIYNTKDFDGEYLLTYLKETIAKTLDENDSINVMVAYDDIVVGSDNWVSCTEDNVDDLFQKVMKRSFPTYSYFQPLMARAADFVNKSQGFPEVIVFSNTDEIKLYSSNLISLADEVLGMFQDTKLHFVDLDNVNSLVYGGNGYYETQLKSFYGRMSDATEGNLYYLRYHDIKTILNAFFYEKISHFESVEVQMTFQNGYSYSKHLMNENEGYYPLDFPIMQVGKFVGDFPIEVKIIGKKQMEKVDTTFTITEEDVSPGDIKIVKSWYGKYIHDLLDFSYDPITTNNIIDMSIAQKILTPYTGFIVLDLNLLKTEEDDENDDDGDEGDDNDPNTGIAENGVIVPEEMELAAYPNPFNSTVTLKINLPEVTDCSLTIYDILGRKIKELDLAGLTAGINYIKWDGDSDDFAALPSGIYFAVLRTEKSVKTIKLFLLE